MQTNIVQLLAPENPSHLGQPSLDPYGAQVTTE
jgi:hypothetical protein